MKPLWAALLTLVVGLLTVPASALAAPPVNDDFADRELLAGALPIEVTRSNVEATKEAGEYIPGLAPAGHSIWFEWEAPGTGWVSVGLCGTAFPTISNVFTGSQVDQLTPVLENIGSAGPRCPDKQGAKHSFRATAGTKYVIAVDGNSFHLPEAPTPVTEGPISLQIEETPPPANDDFAAAEVVESPINEEPGGSRFYFADAFGYNWAATTETGEPFHGTGSGASVWYRWTVPEDGRYSIGACCGTLGLNWTLYSGSSLDDLTENLSATGSAEVTLSGGQTHWIAVYGTPDLDTGEPTMSSFTFIISTQLPPLPRPQAPSGGGSASPPPSDVDPPVTTIVKRVLKRKPPVFVFRFASNEPESSFRCSLDRRPFRPCGSSRVFSRARPGRHRLRVYAVDAAGNADPTPAVAHFKFPPRKRR